MSEKELKAGTVKELFEIAKNIQPYFLKKKYKIRERYGSWARGGYDGWELRECEGSNRIHIIGALEKSILEKWTKKKTRFGTSVRYIGIRDLPSIINMLDPKLGKQIKDAIAEQKKKQNAIGELRARNYIRREARQLRIEITHFYEKAKKSNMSGTVEEIAAQEMEADE